MSSSSELAREMESYLGFLIDLELDDVYENEPLNRTLSENKPAIGRAVAGAAQKTVKVVQGPAGQGQAPAQGGHTPGPVVIVKPALPQPDLATFVHEAKGRANAARTLDELYAELEAFKHMPMRHEGAKNLVRHRGSLTPRLLVIGDAPDADEDASGQAFAGKPGAMIDMALKAAGIFDDAMLSCSAFWRPAGGRPLTAEDVSLTQPFVHALIRLVEPEALLLLGAGAVTCALNLEQSLQKLRGRTISYGDGDKAIPVMASYPPAFMIRQPAAKGLFWRDLLRITAAINKV